MRKRNEAANEGKRAGVRDKSAARGKAAAPKRARTEKRAGTAKPTSTGQRASIATRSSTAKTPAPKRAAPRTAYHHGDLRQALLAATEEILETSGVEGFTLRECARRAGVSHAAPAHHFGDVAGLLGEFTAISFEQLDAEMTKGRAAAGPKAVDQLIATGVAYVTYAVTHPHRFRLMFRGARVRQLPQLLEASSRTYRHLRECMEATDRDAGGDARLIEEKTVLAWSIVHGFAQLMLDNPGFAAQVNASGRGVAGAIRRVLRLSQSSYEARALIDED